MDVIHSKGWQYLGKYSFLACVQDICFGRAYKADPDDCVMFLAQKLE